MVNILLTGPPRSGKTTIIKQLIRELKGKKIIGFFTSEIRENNNRIGFEIETLSGYKKILASKKNKESKHRVSSYGVYLNNLDYIIEQIKKELNDKNFRYIIVDEIGKMELFSLNFKKFVLTSLDTKKVIGTIMLRDDEFTKKIKQRKDTKIIHVNKENRDSLKDSIIGVLDDYA